MPMRAQNMGVSILKWFNQIIYPTKYGDRDKIILIPYIITEILTKTRFSVMAALICILRGLPRAARVASFEFLKSTPQRYRNRKKTLYCKVVQKSGIWQPDYLV